MNMYTILTATKQIIGQKIYKFLTVVSIIACIGTNLASATESIAKNLAKKDGKPGGSFTVKTTWYCNCFQCTGKTPDHPAYGITASGRKARPGTIAVDRKLIPLGSRVWIEGIGECRAEDVGGAIKGKHIDVWCVSHKEALRNGVQYLNVKILPN